MASFPATGAGYGQFLDWMRSWGDLDAVGIEGTGSYGAGLARHLAAGGVTVVEVIRPRCQSAPAPRQVRSRRRGGGGTGGVVRRSDGPPEVRRRSRRSNTAPARDAALRREGPHPGDQPAQRTPRHRRRAGRSPPVRGLATGALVNACARLRPNPDSGEVVAAAKASAARPRAPLRGAQRRDQRTRHQHRAPVPRRRTPPCSPLAASAPTWRRLCSSPRETTPSV